MSPRTPRPAALLAALALCAPAAARAQATLLSPPYGAPGQTVVASGMLVGAAQSLYGTPWTVQPAGAGVAILNKSLQNPNTGAFTVTLGLAPTAAPGLYRIQGGTGRIPTLVATFQVVGPNGPTAERVVGPRIDAIRPPELAQGSQVHLDLAGKNLSAAMRLDLGPGVQLLGAPVVYSPAAAAVDVLVSPAAPLGPREAAVADATGSNTGPGGVEILPAAQVAAAPPLVAVARQKVVPAIRPIDVVAPLDPDSARCTPAPGRTCDAPAAVEGTRFSWREREPGLASYFVWELVDCSGAVLASAQTRRPELTLTPDLLAALPPVDAGGAPRTTACAIQKLDRIRADAGLLRLPGASGKAAASLPTSPAGLGPWSAAHAWLAPAPPAAPGIARAGASPGRILAVSTAGDGDAWKLDAGLVVWRVKGYAPERFVDGALTGDMVQVEDSDENGLVAPLPPTGLLSCGGAGRASSVTVGPVAAPGAAPASGPCDLPGTLCAGEDHLARLGGTVDLSRLPFDVGLPGYPGVPLFPAGHAFLPIAVAGAAGAAPAGAGGDAGPQAITLPKVFVDWGDGSEPDPLSVLVTSKQSWGAVRIADGMRHAYLRPSGGAGYQVRIYADGDPDAGHPTRTATATSLLHLAAATPGAPGARSAPPGSALARLAVGASSSAGAAAVSALEARHPETFLVACLQATVVAGPEQGSDGALHLLAAAIAPPDGLPAPLVDGSDALRPGVRITYWGRGRVKVSWFLDGDATPIEEDEPPNELPAVGRLDGEAGRAPVVVSATASVPATAAGSPHRLTARVTALQDPPAASVTGDGRVLRLSSARHSFREVHTVVTAAGIGPAPVSAAEAPIPGLPPRHVVEGVVAAVTPGEAAAGGTGDPPPAAEVDAPAYPFDVRPRQPGDPRDLVYETAVGQAYRVTDVTGFTTGGDGTSSGKGILHLFLPAPDGASLHEEHVPIAFAGWKVDTSGSGDWKVKAWSGDLPVSTTLHPLGFDLRLARLHLQKGVVEADGALSIGALQGVPLPAGVTPPAWAFDHVPVPPSGDLLFDVKDAGKLPIGDSGFVLDVADVVVDLSRTAGDAPKSGSCLAGGAGPGWMGVILSGKLAPPGFAIRGKQILKEVDVRDVAVGAGGFTADATLVLGVSQAVGPMTVKADSLALKACNGSFDAKVQVEVDGVPIVGKPITGTLDVTLDGKLVADFEAPKVHADLGVVVLDVDRAALTYSTAAGDWVVGLDADATLKLPGGATVFQHRFPTFDVTMDGGLGVGGASAGWFPAGDAGTGDLGGFPVQVTQLGLGLASSGDFWFGLSGGVRISDVLEAQASQVKFLLAPSGGGLRPDGVEVGDLHVDLKLPSVHATADVTFSAAGGRTRFGGAGEVALLGAGVGVQAEFLYGTDAGRTYWLAKGSFSGGGAGIPLPPTPLALYGVDGGIAHNVDLATYDLPVKDVKPRFDGSYLVSAGVQVGTVYDGGFTFYGDGKLTLKLGGAPAARLDAAAWILSEDHGGAPAARGCLQYAGGAFDAGFQVDLALAGGAVEVHAPGGADVCTDSAVSVHFGAGEDWHVWLGRRAEPVKASILFVHADGWLAVDRSGVDAGVRATAGGGVGGSVLGCGWSLSYQETVLVDVGLAFHPFQASGELAGAISGDASACFGSIGFDGSLDLRAQAPNPTQICGAAGVGIDAGWFHPHASFDVCL